MRNPDELTPLRNNDTTATINDKETLMVKGFVNAEILVNFQNKLRLADILPSRTLKK